MFIDDILTDIINSFSRFDSPKDSFYSGFCPNVRYSTMWFDCCTEPYQIRYIMTLARKYTVDFKAIITPYIICREKLFKYIYMIYKDTVELSHTDRSVYISIMEGYLSECAIIASKNMKFNILEFLCEEWKNLKRN